MLPARIVNENNTTSINDEHFRKRLYQENAVVLFPTVQSTYDLIFSQFPAFAEFPENSPLTSNSQSTLSIDRNDSAEFIYCQNVSGGVARKIVFLSLVASLMASPNMQLSAQQVELINKYDQFATQLFAGENVKEYSHLIGTDNFSWFTEVYSFDKANLIDAAIDLVFKKINSMFKAGEFFSVNNFIESFDIPRYSIHISLALLTITLVAKNKLSSRTAFFERVKAHLIAQGIFEDAILAGLA